MYTCWQYTYYCLSVPSVPDTGRNIHSHNQSNSSLQVCALSKEQTNFKNTIPPDAVICVYGNLILVPLHRDARQVLVARTQQHMTVIESSKKNQPNVIQGRASRKTYTVNQHYYNDWNSLGIPYSHCHLPYRTGKTIRLTRMGTESHNTTEP